MWQSYHLESSFLHYKVRRFYRPEDVNNIDILYTSDWWEVYSGPEIAECLSVKARNILGRCSVELAGGSSVKGDEDMLDQIFPFGALAYA